MYKDVHIHQLTDRVATARATGGEEGVAGVVGARAESTDTVESKDILLRHTHRKRKGRGDDNCVDTHTTGGWKRECKAE